MIVGTAGHIDHGKTALVRTLTGVDTDRLKEEKARGISIDLGFAYLPAGERTLGFVDVPGHERFVRNMLAGATGIDFVLLVVAADDGVMPQTREHLAIVDLLGLTRGCVALTKADLVSAERLAEATDEVRRALQPTGLADAEMMPVSTVTGEGVDALRARLVEEAQALGSRTAEGRFRLAVDRAFSKPGAGTIVTGAVLSGSVAVGDTVLISPDGAAARVRSIHAQNRPAGHGRAGERCALNLTGEAAHRSRIARGDVALDPALHAPAERIDAELRLLAGEPRPLRHWTPVRLHHAAAEVGARVALLSEEPIAPGADALVQLVLDRPIAAAAGDRFILRDTSGARTMGGGRFIDLRAPHRRRRTPERLAQLQALRTPEPLAALAALIERWPWFVDVTAFARDHALGEDWTRTALELVPHVPARLDEALLAFSPDAWAQLAASARAALEAYHTAHPELPGLAPARLGAALQPRLPARIAAAAVRALVASGALAFEGGAVRTPEHRFGLDAKDQRLWARIEPLLSDDERFRPPRAAEIAPVLHAPVGEVRRVLKAKARLGAVAEVAPDHWFRRDVLHEIAGICADIASGQPDGEFTAAQLRDRLNNGRKVAIQLLEHFDRRGATLRRGDLRRINPARIGQFAAGLQEG